MLNRWLVEGGYPVSRLRDEVDRVFSEVFADIFDHGRRMQDRGFPALNMWEDEGSLYVEAEVPGLKMDDLEILVKGDELSIRGERAGEDREDVTYHRRERRTGSFCSVVRLPVEVEVEKVEGHLVDGVLTVTLPKAAAARARKIEVQAVNA